jgi:hypothetical protein
MLRGQARLRLGYPRGDGSRREYAWTDWRPEAVANPLVGRARYRAQATDRRMSWLRECDYNMELVADLSAHRPVRVYVWWVAKPRG